MNNQLEFNAGDLVKNSSTVTVRLKGIKKYQRRVSFGMFFVKLGFYIIGMPVEVDMVTYE